jgi:hypothetical protein
VWAREGRTAVPSRETDERRATATRWSIIGGGAHVGPVNLASGSTVGGEEILDELARLAMLVLILDAVGILLSPKVTNVSLLAGAALRQHGAGGGKGLELRLDVLQLVATLAAQPGSNRGPVWVRQRRRRRDESSRRTGREVVLAPTLLTLVVIVVRIKGPVGGLGGGEGVFVSKLHSAELQLEARKGSPGGVLHEKVSM